MSTSSRGLRPFQPVPFGRYTLLTPIAKGGMGAVYLARMASVEGFEKLVVIKKILPALAQEQSFVERFVDEAKIVVKLQHGSIAQVLDMGVEDGEYYIAMEFVDGKDLRKVSARAREGGLPLPAGLALYVTVRVLDALAYAHRKKDSEDRELNLVHRDISPQNILVSYEGEVKVIDFGLAKSALTLNRTSPSVVLGKFFYMSPEQARHQPVDRRSDLYATAICLWELLTGHNPFDGLRPGEIMRAVANPSIPPLREARPDLPESLDQALMKALAINPDDRYGSAEEMRGRLTAVMLELDPAAGPERLATFMREQFAREHESERKAIAALARLSSSQEPEPAREHKPEHTGEGPTETISASDLPAFLAETFKPTEAVGLDATAPPVPRASRNSSTREQAAVSARGMSRPESPASAHPARRRTREAALPRQARAEEPPTPVGEPVLREGHREPQGEQALDPPTPVNRSNGFGSGGHASSGHPSRAPSSESPSALRGESETLRGARAEPETLRPAPTRRLPTAEVPRASAKLPVAMVVGALCLIAAAAVVYFAFGLSKPAGDSVARPGPTSPVPIARPISGTKPVDPPKPPDPQPDRQPDPQPDTQPNTLATPDLDPAPDPDPKPVPAIDPEPPVKPRIDTSKLSRRQRLTLRYEELLSRDAGLRERYSCDRIGNTCKFRELMSGYYRAMISAPKKYDKLEELLDQWESALESRRKEIEEAG